MASSPTEHARHKHHHHHHHHRLISTPDLLTAAAGGAAARRRAAARGGGEQQQHTAATATPPPLPPVYLVVLNHHLPAVTAQLWPHAALRVAADGGANRIHDELPALARRVARERRRWQRQQAGASGDAKHQDDEDDDDDPETDSHDPLSFVPDALVGDLDSVRPEVLSAYGAAGARVADLSHDQDSTDLDKCLLHVEDHLVRTYGRLDAGVNEGEQPSGSTEEAAAAAPLLPRHHVVVVGALGGRLDHTLSNLGALHRFPHLNVTIWSDGNTVRLVRGSGEAEGGNGGGNGGGLATRVVADTRIEGPACGVVPLAGGATVTSKGLRWDMSETRLSFGVGGLLSTSNILGGSGGGGGEGAPAPPQTQQHEAVVELSADSDVLWMAEAHDAVPPHVWADAEARAQALLEAAEEERGGKQRGGGA
jgi:thiamine pyrophosphokinase